ncbi:hypothetical protein [Streptacidiphilus jiangxiensis]|uniref:PknH-like extracellular domain-containing protein n=1 Tax=Streptacidiphilus jiangxiensis TaxID=235985 RepID=A0A1H7PKZ7_STRJI|nr:hypothetical protein [Streptacidiphilus jiangxiensis]SEL36453.1 hypothetical protein SAMN05414137_10810 [Streptacidiphilus jiangxiensis]
MNENQTVRRTSVRRNRVAAAAACFAAALITAGVVGVQSASADGADGAASATQHTAVATPGLGSAALVQSEDFLRGVKPAGATVTLTGRQGLSACSGEETMHDLTKGKATAYASVTWTFGTDGLLTESAASAPSGSTAATWEKQLVALVQDCQDEPAGHWHYGAAHTLTLPGGTGRWYPSVNGDGRASGGVAILRSGTRVAIVELTGRPADGPASVKAIATAALNRLPS